MRKLIIYFWPLVLGGIMFLVYALASENHADKILSINFLIVLPLICLYYLKISHPEYRYFFPISITLLCSLVPYLILEILPESVWASSLDETLTGELMVKDIIIAISLGVMLVFYSLRFYHKRKKRSLDWVKWVLITSCIALALMIVFRFFFYHEKIVTGIIIAIAVFVAILFIIHIIDLYRMDRMGKHKNYDQLIDEIKGSE